MHGIFTYMCLLFMVNVGKFAIHWTSGQWKQTGFFPLEDKKRLEERGMVCNCGCGCWWLWLLLAFPFSGRTGNKMKITTKLWVTTLMGSFGTAVFLVEKFSEAKLNLTSCEIEGDDHHHHHPFAFQTIHLQPVFEGESSVYKGGLRSSKRFATLETVLLYIHQRKGPVWKTACLYVTSSLFQSLSANSCGQDTCLPLSGPGWHRTKLRRCGEKQFEADGGQCYLVVRRGQTLEDVDGSKMWNQQPNWAQLFGGIYILSCFCT